MDAMAITQKDGDIAQTIFEQIGGKAFAFMVGMKKETVIKNGMMFRFMRNSTPFNHCLIRLNAWDTYDVTFTKVGGRVQWPYASTPTQTHSCVYFDQLRELFESVTGLATRVPKIITVNA